MNTFKFLLIDDKNEKYYADVIINEPKLVIDVQFLKSLVLLLTKMINMV